MGQEISFFLSFFLSFFPKVWLFYKACLPCLSWSCHVKLSNNSFTKRYGVTTSKQTLILYNAEKRVDKISPLNHPINQREREITVNLYQQFAQALAEKIIKVLKLEP